MLTVKGIIIRVVDYKEKDRLLSIATFEKGLICVNAKGVRGASAKLKGYSNLLTFGDFTITETKAGYILSGVDSEENFFSCWSDTLKYSACMLCIELFEKVSKEQDDINYELVILLKALKEINYSSTYSLIFALQFMVLMTSNLGVDNSEIANYDIEVYNLIQKLLCSENDINNMEFRENNVISGIKFLNLLLKSSLNINLKVIHEILKAL